MSTKRCGGWRPAGREGSAGGGSPGAVAPGRERDWDGAEFANGTNHPGQLPDICQKGRKGFQRTDSPVWRTCDHVSRYGDRLVNSGRTGSTPARWDSAYG